jgi:hypothetical protein
VGFQVVRLVTITDGARGIDIDIDGIIGIKIISVNVTACGGAEVYTVIVVFDLVGNDVVVVGTDNQDAVIVAVGNVEENVVIVGPIKFYTRSYDAGGSYHLIVVDGVARAPDNKDTDVIFKITINVVVVYFVAGIIAKQAHPPVAIPDLVIPDDVVIRQDFDTGVKRTAASRVGIVFNHKIFNDYIIGCYRNDIPTAASIDDREWSSRVYFPRDGERFANRYPLMNTFPTDNDYRMTTSGIGVIDSRLDACECFKCWNNNTHIPS